jgi:uncharacterized protein YecE (DUF72 family)
VGADFAFSVVMPRVIATLTGESADDQLEHALGAARALSAQWLVLQTPASVTPSRRSIDRLAELVNRLPRESWRLGWEPRGVWEHEEAERIGAELDISVIADISRQPVAGADVLYSRIRGLGASSTLPSGAIEAMAEQLDGLQQAFIVVETDDARRVASVLRRALSSDLSGTEEEDASEAPPSSRRS